MQTLLSKPKLITLPFKSEFKYLMLAGKKTCTSRTTRYGYVGDEFEAFGKLFTIVKVERLTLDEIKRLYWKQEGCRSPGHFQWIWKGIHPKRGYIGMDRVYVYHFREKHDCEWLV